MTVIDRRARAATAAATEYAVRPLDDPEEIRRLIEPSRPYAAYALGQLDPDLFALSRWWLARGEGGQALALHARGGLGNAMFALGEARALEALLLLHPGPRRTFLTCEVDHLDTIVRYFELEQRQTMIRMRVIVDAFAPVSGDVRRLTGRDARALNSLYRTEGAPSFYSSRQIDDSIYYGAFRDGRLVAVAGTHVISAASGIAVIGNVYTHPRYRGQRLAEATTSAVTQALLRTCGEVVLSVDPTNAPAVRAYRRLGYGEVARLIEGAAVRRDVLGIASGVRRTLARMRGGPRGELIVRVAR